MAIADRYEGQDAGTCGCGSALVWALDAHGQWRAEHVDQEQAMACSSEDAVAEPLSFHTDGATAA